MMENNSPTEIIDKKERIKNWLKNPYNLIFLALFIGAIILRLYYFSLTKNQPIWWDESEYLSAAKGYAGIVDFKLPSLRFPGFSLLASLFYSIGISNEVVLKFILAFIPSIIVLFLLYFCVSEMYNDKKIALISLIILAVLWEHAFYSNRFHTENFALMFQLLAVLILFRGYLKGKNSIFIKAKYSLLWISIFSVLAVFFRPGNVIFLPALIIFIIFLKIPKPFTKKTGGILALLMAFSIGAVYYLNTLPKEGMLAYLSGLNNPVSFNSLSVFSGFYASFVKGIPTIWYYAFLFGLAMVIFDFFIFKRNFKEIKKDNGLLEFKSDLFNFLTILFVLASFIFILRVNQFEYRWFFPLIIGMTAFTSKGIVLFSNYLGNLINKRAIVILILLIVILGAYNQMSYTDDLLKAKSKTYIQVKESGLWLKENSNPDDLIVSASKPQHIYYTERKVYNIGEMSGIDPQKEEILDQKVQELRPRYLILSVFENVPQWIYNWPQRHNQTVIPVQVYMLEQNNPQPALIIYELKY